MDQAFQCRVAIPKEQVWNPHRIPKGHLRELVSPGPGSNILSTVDVDEEGDEDETSDVQVVVWRDLFPKRCRVLGALVIEVTGRVSMWDGAKDLIAMDLSAVRASETMPPSHRRY